MGSSLSVILPVYNAARYLRAALASLQQQTVRDFEVIAVDDGSTDGSKAILDEVAKADPRLRVISRPNTGIVGALNDALAEARGDFVARMDADDVAEPTRFAEQLSFLVAHPDRVALGTAVWIIDDRDRVIDRWEPPANSTAIETALLDGNGGALIHPSAVFRRAAINAVGGYRREFDLAEDLDLYFRLLAHGTLANLTLPLLRYRHHVSSSNFTRRTRQQQRIQQVLDRERSQRGQPPIDIQRVVGHSDQSHAERYRGWACSAVQHGSRGTAFHYAFRALARAPWQRQSWRTLRYLWSYER